MRRFVAAISVALILTSSAAAAFASEPVVVDQNGVPVTVISVGMTLRSDLDPSNQDVIRVGGRYTEMYRLDVERGQCAEITMRSEDLDSTLTLLDAEGKRFAQDDDSGGGNDALLKGTFENAGPVFIVASTADRGETGRYTLAVRACEGARPASPQQPARPPSSSPSRGGSTYPMM